MTNPRGSALEALAALYDEVDALYADARCPASTECCRFGITGREPQVTSVEVALVARALARSGRGTTRAPLAASKRALPLSVGALSERACPLLDRAGKCAVYAARPLGCRTFYCARAELPAAPDRHTLRELVRRLQHIALVHEPAGDRPRSLSAALAAR